MFNGRAPYNLMRYHHSQLTSCISLGPFEPAIITGIIKQQLRNNLKLEMF